MKKLFLILSILITSVGYSQTPPNVDVDSVIYYFVEMVNEEKFRIGPVFDGVIEEVYEKKFYEKNGKWINDTVRMSFAEPQKLKVDSGLTLGAEYQAEYLRLYNDINNSDEIYISHYQKDDIDGFKTLYTWIDRANYLKTDRFTEIVTAGGISTFKGNINKEIAKSAFDAYYNSKGHRKKMIKADYSKIGVSIKFLNNGLNYVFVSTLT